jgi:hypothetical protein
LISIVRWRTNQQITGLVHHQDGLLVDRFDGDEAHGRTGRRLADRFGIGGIGLSAHDVGPHVGRRHQLHRMAQLADLTRPVMGTRARLHPN